MAEGGNAKEVFRKLIPKVTNILVKDPPFTIVTACLNAQDLITDQELEAINTKQGVKRGSEVAYTLRDKIKESDDPNACLLKICDVFESDDVDNATLKKLGANMRASISNGAAATPAPVPTVTPSAPPYPLAVAPNTNPNELSIADLVLVLSVLSQAMFGSVHWTDLGLSLGLFMPTLNVIGRTNGDANDYLKLTLQKWLEKKDKVTGTTWHDLIRAVKSTGDKAAAERIPGILKSITPQVSLSNCQSSSPGATETGIKRNGTHSTRGAEASLEGPPTKRHKVQQHTELSTSELFRSVSDRLASSISSCLTTVSGKLNAEGLIAQELHDEMINGHDIDSKKLLS